MVLDFSKIGLRIKNYSFNSKMNFCFRYSIQLIDLSGLKPVHQLKGKPLPWELEAFLLFVITYDEVSQKRINEKEFAKIINSIKNYQPKGLSEDNFVVFQCLSAMTLTQFDIQIPFFQKLYRYNYFFNFQDERIDVSNIFFQKFGTKFEKFIELAGYLQFSFDQLQYYNSRILDYLVLCRYKDISKLLTISREGYKEELRQYSDKDEDFAYCVRPSYTYAFIQYDDCIYFPLPHLLSRNVTNSLLFRLTKDNNKLRSEFGRIFEKYIFDILKEAQQFNEIYSEKKYRHQGNIYHSSDIMCKADSDYLFFECKFSVPQAYFRNFDKESFDHEIDKLAKNIIQVYKSFIRFTKHIEYSPFIEKEEIDPKDFWGIIVVLEYSNIDNRLIYSKVADMLGLDMKSEKMLWICNHIKISDISDIERYCFNSLDFVYSLTNQEKSESFFNFAFSNNSKAVRKKVESSSLDDFKLYYRGRITLVMTDLLNKGYIKKE